MARPFLETGRTLPEVLADNAGGYPERIALTFLDERGNEHDRLTFGELAAGVEDRAGRLAARHRPGERLVLALPTGRDFVVLLLAAMRAGLIPVPAPTPRSSSAGAQRLGSIVRSSAAAALVTTDALRPLLCRDRMGIAADVALSTPEEIRDVEEPRQPPGIGSHDIAFLQYSSGSTGAPKGIVNRHATVLANERMLRDALGHGEGSVAVSWLPLFHDMGLIAYLLQSLCVGGHLVAMSPLTFLKRPVRWLEAIDRYRAQTSGAPNSSYDYCAERISAAEKENLDLSTWSTLMVSAEPLRAATIRRLLAAFAANGLRESAVWTGYGLAEATVFVTGQRRGRGLITLDLDREALARGRSRQDPAGGATAVSSGQPWGDLEIRIVDPESGCALDAGRIGEVWIAGSTVAGGYWNDPAATAETFGARLADTGEGPFLRTGDLGFLHAGDLFITGRIKDTILVEGANVYPQDLEAAIEDSHPGLRRGYCAAFAVDDGQAERIVAVAEVERSALRAPASGADGGAELKAVAAAACAAVAREQDVRLHRLLLVRPGTVSRTSSGKLRRGACRARYLSGELEDARIV